MQKLMQKLTKLLICSAITFSIGCTSKVKKPVIELCLVVIKDTLENSKCVCGPTDSQKVKELSSVSYINAVGNILDEPVWRPIQYCNKATALRPAEWQKLQDYLHELEIEIKNRLPKYVGDE